MACSALPRCCHPIDGVLAALPRCWHPIGGVLAAVAPALIAFHTA